MFLNCLWMTDSLLSQCHVTGGRCFFHFTLSFALLLHRKCIHTIIQHTRRAENQFVSLSLPLGPACALTVPFIIEANSAGYLRAGSTRLTYAALILWPLELSTCTTLLSFVLSSLLCYLTHAAFRLFIFACYHTAQLDREQLLLLLIVRVKRRGR